MTIGQAITEAIENVIRDLGFPKTTFVVEPSDLQHGDYATNVAMVLYRNFAENIKGHVDETKWAWRPNTIFGNPRELAETIAEKLTDPFMKVSVAGPGFVNIRLTDEALAAAIKDEKPGHNDSLKGKKYIIEYTDPNPFKEFHIGHLMSNTIGESLSRLIAVSGAETKRACYQGDVGMHVAMAVWGRQKDPSLPWGQAYALGATTYKNGSEAEKSEIASLNKVIYQRTDSGVNTLYDDGKVDSLRYFEEIYKKLDTTFDHYFFESKTAVYGKEIVEKNTGIIFEKSEGAIVYKGDESKGLHTRVFINKEGLPTYEAKELGLAKIKYDIYNYDHSIVVTANEVNDYFRVLLDAMSKVFPDLASKTEHIGHGMMRLPTGKMSSRTGDVITAESMIADVKIKVLEKMVESDVPHKENVAELVAIAAIKYSILRQAPGKDIIFDLDQATSFEGDSGPYLQYTFARTRQLLKKGESRGMAPDAGSVEHGNLSRLLARFGDVVLRAEGDRAPQYVTTYLTQLAQEFNSYYGANLIVDENDKKTSSGRLALVDAVGKTMQMGLWMLGIKAPEMM